LKAVAKRYANALVDVALKQKSADKIKAELGAFVDLLGDSTDLRNFLASPAVPKPPKQAVIAKLAQRLGASKTLENFLHVLVENRRTHLLPEIQQAYHQQLLVRLGVAEVHVVSARGLSAPERAELEKALGKITGKRVEARYGEDPSLIGGAVVWVGSTVYDGSVRTQLNRLRAKLAAE